MEERPVKSQETGAVGKAERLLRPGRACGPRSQEVINPSQTVAQ